MQSRGKDAALVVSFVIGTIVCGAVIAALMLIGAQRWKEALAEPTIPTVQQMPPH